MQKSLFVMCVLLAGCGLSNGKKLKDLSADDAQKLCDEYSDPVTESCDVGGTSVDVTIGGDECDASDGADLPDTCEATVGDFRDCYDALVDDPCAMMDAMPSECDWIADCMGGGTTPTK